MAQITTLSPFAGPGGVYSFLNKHAVTGDPHNPGKITTLGPGAWPGRLRTFVAKSGPWVFGDPHNPGHITTLMPYGVSGRRYAFAAKTRDEITYPIDATKQQLHGWNKRRVLQYGGRYPGRRPR